MKNTKVMPFKNIQNFHTNIEIDPNTIVERKSFIDVFEIKNINENEKEIIGIISKPSIDHDGDIIMPLGMSDKYYKDSRLVIWNHDLGQPPIGEVYEYSIDSTGVIGRFRFSESYQFAKDVKSLISEGILKGISIGFIPTKILKAGTEAFNSFAKANNLMVEGCRRIIQEAFWLETSVVPIGANQDALFLAAKSFDPETCKALKVDIPIESEECEKAEEQLIQTTPVPEAITTTKESEIEVKPIKETEDNKPIYHWGNLTNESEEDLRRIVYGIWENLGSIGSFDYFWQNGKLEEPKKISFTDLGTKRSQMIGITQKAYSILKGLPYK